MDRLLSNNLTTMTYLIISSLILSFLVVAKTTEASPSQATSASNQLLTTIDQFMDNVENASGRSNDFTSDLEEFLTKEDLTIPIPFLGSAISIQGRKLNDDDYGLKLKFKGDVEEGRKRKLKKIFVPILVFVLIKAMILIPLALGILALKTWNALQLSFGSFVVALGMAVWSFCRKISGETVTPHIVSHGSWEPPIVPHYAARADEAQNLAYSSHMKP